MLPADSLLLQMHEQGMSYKQIADETGRTCLRSLERRIRNLKRLPDTDPANSQRGRPVPNTIEQMDDVDRQLVDMYLAKASFEEIAMSTGYISTRSVASRIALLRESLGEGYLPRMHKKKVSNRQVKKPAEQGRDGPVTRPCICCRREFNSPSRLYAWICRKCKDSIERNGSDGPFAI